MKRDKKYEGYSTRPAVEEIKKKKVTDEKPKGIEEEFIANLHQQIYYLEMQLKLL